LVKLIEKIESSVSAREPYCLDLVKDIKECLCGMRDYESFVVGIHCAQAYSEMYFLERSTGPLYLIFFERYTFLQLDHPSLSLFWGFVTF
jgi:hypothetical protein